MPDDTPETTMMQAANLARLSRYLREHGVAPEPLLREAGAESTLVEQPGALVTLRVNALAFQLAADRLGDPALGLAVARASVEAKAYALHSLLFANSPDLRSALGTLEALYNAMLADARCKLDVQPDRARFSVRWVVDVPGLELIRQESIAALYLHSKAMTGGDWLPLGVSVEEKPADVGPFRELFGVDVRTGADRDEIVIPGDVLDRPNPNHDPLLLVHLREAAETHIRKRREAAGARDDLLRLVGVVVDLRTGALRRGEESDRLTPREHELLLYLVRRANKVVTHDEIEREVWGLQEAVVTYAPAVAIRRLRRKIEPDEKNPVNLITEFGEGWRLKVS